MTSRPAKSHYLVRTSPKGRPFIGTCTLCGTPNLTDPNGECANIRGLTSTEALIETIADTPIGSRKGYAS